MTEYQPGKLIVLERNDDYYLEDVPCLDRVEFLLDFKDRDNILQALKSGEIDLTLDLPASLSKLHQEGNEEINLVTKIELSTHFFGFQCQTSPFDDKRVRQAIALLMPPADLWIEDPESG